MQRAKLIAIAVLIVVAVILFVGNREKTTVWLFADVDMPRALLLIITTGIGYAAGLLTALHVMRRTPKKSG